jgi:hypothetical protein
VLRRFMPFPLALASLNPRSNLRRAMVGTGIALDGERIDARELEGPSGGGVGTARAIAQAYSVFATGGRELGLRAETLEALKAPALPSRHGFYDALIMQQIADANVGVTLRGLSCIS